MKPYERAKKLVESQRGTSRIYKNGDETGEDRAIRLIAVALNETLEDAAKTIDDRFGPSAHEVADAIRALKDERLERL